VIARGLGATIATVRTRRQAVTTARYTKIALIALVAIGALLRFRGLGRYPLDFDESFTAMVGRLPLRTIPSFLRVADSHPPLDYLLQLPLARIAASPFVFRLPAALSSTAALAVFAYWMRGRGGAGIAATAAMTICAFQIAHGREARMYGPLELLGVCAAVVADAWLRAPRRWHSVFIGALTFAGLMTHVSMALLAIGLLAIAGLRRDEDAWWWRAGILTGTCGWALFWGRSFVEQARGGHSQWIPHTTPTRFVDAVGALVSFDSRMSVLVFAAIVAGGFVCWHRDRTLASVLTCCFGVPAVLGALVGLRAPVLIPRTLTVVSWGPLVALGYLAAFVVERRRSIGVCGVAAATVAMLVRVPTVYAATGPTAALAELERVARAGDVIAIEPPSKGVELDWSFAARSDDGAAGTVSLPGLTDAVALALTARPSSGRIWVMQMSPDESDLRNYRMCARPWHHGPLRMLCLRARMPAPAPHTSPPSIAALYNEFASRHAVQPHLHT